jgi:fatty-acyl-CoA synthase
MSAAYDQDLPKTAANYAALTPLSFIERAAAVYPEAVAVVHGGVHRTWSQTYARCRQLASVLARRGLGKNSTVSVMLHNTPEMMEAHFAIPMAGAVIHAINTRLEPEAIAFQLLHGESELLIVDREFASVMAKVLPLLSTPLAIVVVHDALYHGDGTVDGMDYEAFIAGGDAQFAWQPPDDEWNAIALSYTSGTTGNPKGVVTHHRGAYLNAISNVVDWELPHFARYMWTLPMFHCNGWCFPWTLAAMAGVNVCLRKVEPAAMWELIRAHRVSHYCGAPIVHTTLANADPALRAGVDWVVKGLVAGAAPPAAMIEAMDRLGFDITHVYGLTEVYGPASVCAKHPDWAHQPLDERVALNGRQGVRYTLQAGMQVMHPETLTPVPADGETMGEIFFRGNITMKGYLKNPSATQAAFAGGWFHSGDLAVCYGDGYAKIKDRSKDIIISGGENVSSLEVEDVLYRHPAVSACAVVAKPDAKWGEVPLAFIELKSGAQASENDLIAHCRAALAGFKVPKAIIFQAIPRTSTGKIQKFHLREQVQSAKAIDA